MNLAQGDLDLVNGARSAHDGHRIGEIITRIGSCAFPAARLSHSSNVARGTWVPDWTETEPDPVPVPTIGWLSWHIGWWWSVAIDTGGT
ncbi:hypothetical protein FHR33_001093 [Nonomuraea dietziae]|uniref:Uncharacterized protein n=1 Tax=Nonomuraea dietziae TaxID=65515 RepID=A0A7W5V2K9_9ACTN|nr:hypothetical protein [Nonomuraea dietziae]